MRAMTSLLMHASAERRVTLPAPEPPMRAVSWPGTVAPLMLFSSSRRGRLPFSSFLCFPGIGTKYCRLRYTCRTFASQPSHQKYC